MFQIIQVLCSFIVLGSAIPKMIPPPGPNGPYNGGEYFIFLL